MKFLIKRKPLVFGITAGFILFGFYFLVLSLANSFSHAVSQFSQMWYWILLLVVGFGWQVGLYSYVYYQIKDRKEKMAAKGEMAASASILKTIRARTSPL